MNEKEAYEVMEDVMRATAPSISVIFKQSVSTSGLKRRSGASTRGFAHKILRDRTTTEPWGLAFSTVRYVYMHHHGMKEKDVKRGDSTYRSKGYSKRGMLTDAAEDGANLLANALVRNVADYMVTGFKF